MGWSRRNRADSDFGVGESPLVLGWGFFSFMSHALSTASVRKGRSSCLDPGPPTSPSSCLEPYWTSDTPSLLTPLQTPTCHHSPGHWQARVEGGSCQRGPGIASFVNAPVDTVQRKGCKGTEKTTKKPAARETGEDGVLRQGQGLLEVEWTGCTIFTAISQEPPHHLILVCCGCHGSFWDASLPWVSSLCSVSLSSDPKETGAMF